MVLLHACNESYERLTALACFHHPPNLPLRYRFARFLSIQARRPRGHNLGAASARSEATD